jgi:enoyl-CoA hydratase/carnithine racemase
MSRPASVDLRGALEGVRYEVRDRIAFVTLARPERGNSLTPRMQTIFRAIWAEVREDPEIRVAILSAAGSRHFCTGFDVGSDDAEETVICAVNGLCVGGGLHFVVDSDIIVASETAAFMDAHVNVGMVGAIENVGLARRLPLGTALRMTLMGRHYRLPARRAYELGLVDELVAPDQLLDTAEGMARAMLENSPQAMALSKQAVWGALERGYGDALEHAWALLRLHWRHPDFVEGPKAFAEKREPRWNPDPNASLEDER